MRGCCRRANSQPRVKTAGSCTIHSTQNGVRHMPVSVQDPLARSSAMMADVADLAVKAKHEHSSFIGSKECGGGAGGEADLAGRPLQGSGSPSPLQCPGGQSCLGPRQRCAPLLSAPWCVCRRRMPDTSAPQTATSCKHASHAHRCLCTIGLHTGYFNADICCNHRDLTAMNPTTVFISSAFKATLARRGRILVQHGRAS